MPSGAPCCAPILQSVYTVLGKRCVECLGCVLLVLRKKVEAPSFSGIGDAASWSFWDWSWRTLGRWSRDIPDAPGPHQSTANPSPSAPLPHQRLDLRLERQLTHAAMHVFASSFLDQDLAGCHNIEGNTPSSISEIIADVSNLRHYSGVPAPS